MDYLYGNQYVPASAGVGPEPASCCTSGSNGAQPAQSPQDRAPFMSGGSVPGSTIGTAPRMGRASCRCWWVALGAVVVIALVVRS